MRNTYVLVGVVVCLVVVGAVYTLNSAHAPSNTASVPVDTDTTTAQSGTMMLTSSAFVDGASIPTQYTCDVTPPGTNFPLSFSGIPPNAVSLALIMDDPDVPTQVLPTGVFDHWVLFNIPPITTSISASSSVGTAGANGAGANIYAAPCPPPQYEPSEHRYFLRLYALDTMLPLSAGAKKQQVLDAMQGHIISQAQLIGKYKRIKQ